MYTYCVVSCKWVVARSYPPLTEAWCRDVRRGTIKKKKKKNEEGKAELCVPEMLLFCRWKHNCNMFEWAVFRPERRGMAGNEQRSAANIFGAAPPPPIIMAPVKKPLHHAPHIPPVVIRRGPGHQMMTRSSGRRHIGCPGWTSNAA